VTGVQTCALPISKLNPEIAAWARPAAGGYVTSRAPTSK
jgi:hypothetical protein